MTDNQTMVYLRCIMETYYGSKDACEEYECQVKISSKSILISYLGDNNVPVVWTGNDDSASGHYTLTCPSVSGRATLHRSPNTDRLEGSWLDGGYTGMWRIELDN